MTSKDVVKEVKSVNEIIYYLKNGYLPHNEEQETYIEDIPSQEDQFTFEAKSNSIKRNLISVGDVENMSLKNKALLSGWISVATRLFSHGNSVFCSCEACNSFFVEQTITS